MDNLSSSIPVASIVTSRDGYQFDLASRKWKLSRDRTVSLEWVQDVLSTSLAESLVKVLVHYAITYSADHTNNICDRFRAFTRWVSAKRGPLERISSVDLISYRSTLDSKHEWYLAVIGGLLKTWVDLRVPGIDVGIPSLLNGWTLRGNTKGLAVQIKCPIQGPLSDLEYEALQQRLLDAFERNEISLADFILVTLFMATGRRPVQLGDLKGLDLVGATSSDGLREFVLNVPRRKQRGSGWRSDFKAVALTPEIGLALRGLILENEAKLRALWPDLPNDLLHLLAVFPDWDAIRKAAKEVPAVLLSLIRSEALHIKTHKLSDRLKNVVASLSVPSERTGKSIKVRPVRLRRTLATRAAREGYGSLIIAELLDHTDDQNARVYTENVPEHVDAINEAVARQLAPLAQAFAGVLVDRESDAVRGLDPKSKVRTDNGDGAGTCGHFGFCGALAPIACYTCRHFQPWLDGAHEEVLQGLIAERDRILEITHDPAIASVNNRTIFAVTEVVQRCEARRAEIEGAKRLG
ncbi:MAG TPA: site-specific integrase [Edaphobacter sp.]|uniref:site-specific integrase n=1 Tax=Edaphobacter sp. TaxID=1934404 RepID=UPI002C8C9635|nr:site-specific integrase [Edaphobacter sp.]HUZ97253.1 site-specific integrase [Edaphobacter sp.]